MAKESGARYGEATQEERKASGYRIPDWFDKAPVPLGAANEGEAPAESEAKSITPETENKSLTPASEPKAKKPARKSGKK